MASKRQHSDDEKSASEEEAETQEKQEDEDSDDAGWIGPLPSEATVVPNKKRKGMSIGY